MVLGNFAYGYVQGYTQKTLITVKATIIDEEFRVGGVNDKPLIFDFGSIDESSNGNLDFIVQYSGVKNNSSKVNLSLNNSQVALLN